MSLGMRMAMLKTHTAEFYSLAKALPRSKRKAG
jgi:hypothetical protein